MDARVYKSRDTPPSLARARQCEATPRRRFRGHSRSVVRRRLWPSYDGAFDNPGLADYGRCAAASFCSSSV